MSARHVLTACALAIGSCSHEPESASHPAQVSLEDITARTGIDMTTVSGRHPARQIIDVNGPGVTLLDMEGDGDLDVFVANGALPDSPENGPGCRLFQNMLRESGTLRFEDATESSGIHVTRWATGASAWDIDVDGDIDLFITCIGNDVVLHNDGQGAFTDVTTESGIIEDAWTTAAVPVDIDADGDLDIYQANYVAWDFEAPEPPRIDFRGTSVLAGPAGLTPAGDRVLLNNGDGTFTDATASLGLDAVEPAYGLNALALDVNEDGLFEVLVGNDGMANALLSLDVDRRLIDHGRESGFATNMAGAKQATMGMAVGDIDGDGAADVFTTNFSSDTNTLLLHRGDSMVDRTHAFALGAPSRAFLGWTTRLIDLDHDGDEDILTLNGHVYPEARVETLGSGWRQTPLVQLRQGDLFTLLDTGDGDGWIATPRLDRSGAFGDLDLDGDLDIVTAELAGPVRVIENRVDNATRRGVVIGLHDARSDASNPAALGARITVNGVHHRWITPGSDFQGWSAPHAHVAVERDRDALDVEVRWPDGVLTTHRIATAPTIVITRRGPP